ncbi:B12-binding domain-containing radical SAM protein [Vibrio parahaemolyticus]|uniref:B12-binding domain-containing radical SAM protein n=1 Tax=Vibrio parahaemolyticus TaxID=670 RepID=UPI003892A414
MERESKKLALVAIPHSDSGDDIVNPLGLHSIAAYLERNSNDLEVRIFDFSYSNICYEAACTEVLEWCPDVVGISIYSQYVEVANRFGHILTTKAPDVLLISGGAHITLMPKDFLSDTECRFDIAISGDGEKPVLELMNLVSKHKIAKHVLMDRNISEIEGLSYRTGLGMIHATDKICRLQGEEWENPLVINATDKIDLVEFRGFDSKKIVKGAVVISSRSCPYRCSFCSITAIDGKKNEWRAIPPDKLVDWLKDAREKLGFDHVSFLDANFFVRKKRVLEFSQLFHKAFNGSVTWSASSTVGYVINLKDDLGLLYRQGLRKVEIGIEAGSQKQLDYFIKHSKVEQNLAAIRLLRKNKIQLGLDFIMFYHDQSIEEVKENLLFIHSAGLTEYPSFDHLYNMLLLYPGTAIRSNLERELNVQFSPNEIPVSRDFIKDNLVKNVYCNYIDYFIKPYLYKIEDYINDISYKLSLNTTNRTQKAKLSLFITALRHVPFKALWVLVENEGRLDSLKDCLDEYEEIIAKYEELYI